MKIEPAQFRAFQKRTALALCLLLLGAAHAYGDSVLTKKRTVTKVAEGVYVIRHPDAPDEFPQGNTTVIIGEREVLVVDSCYLPSSAREDIAQIRQWTNKPVRYLLNTHWHGDHVYGNAAYLEAFPQLTIISQVETRRIIAGYYHERWFEEFPKRTEALRRMVETGKDEEGKPLPENRRNEITRILPGREVVVKEFRNLSTRLPTLTFDRELHLDLGNREVQIKFLGRGNTSGDTIVYLPAEKILIAGDLLDHPVPYLGGGFPSELIKTLKAMSELETETIVPGHGDVLVGKYGRDYLTLVIDFLQAVVAQVNLEVFRLGNSSRNLEAVRAGVEKKLDLNSWRQKFTGDDKDNRDFFDGFSMPGLITAAYRETWGK